MGYAIGSLTKGAGDDCHKQFLGVLKTLCEAAGWVTMRYVTTPGSEYELILKCTGYSGTETYYVGFKTNTNPTGSPYYNIKGMCAIGFDTGATFELQPGVQLTAFRGDLNSMGYFVTVSPQRITGATKVGSVSYDHFYLGKYFQYATPNEFPMPLFVAGSITPPGNWQVTAAGAYHQYYLPANSAGFIRLLDGSWDDSNWGVFPQWNSFLRGSGGIDSVIPLAGYYNLEPCIIHQRISSAIQGNIYGEIEGIYSCNGYNSLSENVIQIGGSSVVDQTSMTVAQAVAAILAVSGRAFVHLQDGMIQDRWRFVAIEMK
jgi:hypothetical protein